MKKGDKDAIFEQETLVKMEKNSSGMVNWHPLFPLEKEITVIKLLNLLTVKPILYVLHKKAGGKNPDEINDEIFKTFGIFEIIWREVGAR